MVNIDFKTANRSAIYYSQHGNLYNKFGEAAQLLKTQTENLLALGFTQYTGKKDILKDLGVRQVINASPGMHDLYTFRYEPGKGTGSIGRISDDAQGLDAFVDMLEARNMCRSKVYVDTSITGNCLFFALYNRPKKKGHCQSK